MAYAVIKTGGKQYRVEAGETLLVERLPDDVGATVELTPLLLAGDGEAKFDATAIGEATVKAEVVGHERGPKLRVFKFKPKRGYRKRTGHRQDLTRIEVTEIKQLSRKPAAKKSTDEPAASDAPAKTQEGDSYWHTRRGSAPPATAAPRTPSASA